MDRDRARKTVAAALGPAPTFSEGACVCIDPPGGDGGGERVLWRPDWERSIVAVDAERVPCGRPDAFDLAAFPGQVDILAEVNGPVKEWAMFSDGDLTFVLKIVAGSLVQGPIQMRFILDGFTGLEERLLTLRRLAGIQRLGRYPAALFPRDVAARKWAFALQVFDGDQAGASQRDIARVMFGSARVDAEWRGVSDSLRQRLRRALALARRLVGGGYRDLLA